MHLLYSLFYWHNSHIITIVNVGDSLDYHNSMKFSTPDQDNDLDIGSCADQYNCGWWFNECYEANPNGPYTNSEKTGWHYNVWFHWKNSYISLKTIRLMIRPRAWLRNVTLPNVAVLSMCIYFIYLHVYCQHWTPLNFNMNI